MYHDGIDELTSAADGQKTSSLFGVSKDEVEQAG